MSYWTFIREHARFLSFGFILCLASNSGQTFFISLSNNTLQKDLGLGSDELGFLYSGATLTSAALMTWVGRGIDRWDLRLYTGIVFLGITAGCLLHSSVESTPLLFVSFLLLRLFGQGLLGHTAMTSMARYFDLGRGRAVSVASLGYPLGEAILPTLATAAILSFGWRATWTGTAGVLALGALPLVLFLLRGHGVRHQALVIREAEDEDAPPPVPLGRVLRDPRFLWMLPALVAPPFIGTGVFFHQSALCREREWDPVVFATFYVGYAVASVVVSIYTGPIVDRRGPRRLAVVYLLPFALGLLGLGLTDQVGMGLGYMIGAGMSAGAASPIFGALWAELYGVHRLGSIRSAVHAIQVFSTACAPGPLGWFLTRGTTTGTLALGGMVFCLIGIVGAFLSIRSKSPTR